MAFPTIPTVAAGRILTTNDTGGSATHTFPSLSSLTKDAGDLLIAVIVQYQGSATDATFGTWGGSFLEFADSSSTTTISIGCAYKWSTGSETGTFTVVGAAQDSAMFLMSIPGAHATTPPEAGGYTTVVGCDPGSLDPTGWAAEDTLWIVVAGCGETATGGSFLGISAAPTSYTDYLDSGITADVVGGVEGAVAFQQLNASSEDPGAFSNDTSNTRGGALVIAVRPVPSAVTGTGLGAYIYGSVASGVAGSVGIAVGSFTFGSTASGIPGVVGAVAEAFTFTGAASGQAGTPPVEGQALGAYTFSSTAAGIVDVAGQALVALTFGSTSAGLVGHSGQAVAAVAFVPTASGVAGVVGQAAAAIMFGSIAQGVPGVVATGLAAFAFTGTANGEIAGAVQGQGLAALSFGSTAQGTVGHDGDALGAFTFAGAASGAAGGTAVQGQALAALVFTAPASGVVGHDGAALGGFVFMGAAISTPPRLLVASNGLAELHATTTGQDDLTGSFATTSTLVASET